MSLARLETEGMQWGAVVETGGATCNRKYHNNPLGWAGLGCQSRIEQVSTIGSCN